MACCALDALSRSATGQQVADSAAAGLPRNSWYPVPVVSRTEVTGLKVRSEEHTSELQSRLHLVCRLLLEKKTMTDAMRIILRRHVERRIEGRATPDDSPTI